MYIRKDRVEIRNRLIHGTKQKGFPRRKAKSSKMVTLG
jgi:hypothetical protein